MIYPGRDDDAISCVDTPVDDEGGGIPVRYPHEALLLRLGGGGGGDDVLFLVLILLLPLPMPPFFVKSMLRVLCVVCMWQKAFIFTKMRFF